MNSSTHAPEGATAAIRQRHRPAVEAGASAARSTGAPDGANRTRQAGVVFDELALLASCVNRLGILLVADQDEDPRDSEALQVAISAISSQMGLIADIGAKLCGGMTLQGADPIKWLLPPIFQSESEEPQGRKQ